MASWDPLDAPIDPLAPPIDPLGPLNRSLGLIEHLNCLLQIIRGPIKCRC